jgi:4-hydroxy-2-oxoheptanedioate aldolase
MIRSNRVKAMLREKGVALGTFVRTTSPPVVEVLGLVGFDFIVIDNEHSPVGLESTANLIRAADGVGLVSIVRVMENAAVHIMRALDAGALGVQVPQIKSRAEAEYAARACKYPPRGIRGLATSHRAARHGLADPAEYVATANSETMLVAYVENADAVDNLEEIVAVPDVDALFIGPADLSASLGYPTQVSHPQVVRAIDRVYAVADEAGIPVGTVAADAESAAALIDKGAQLIAISSDLQMIGRWSSGTLHALRG